MRGKVLQNLISQGIVGITPAYAGKRTTGYGYGIRREDHPRVCGEKAPKVVELAAKEGSPPRVRGKVNSFAEASSQKGITPAYAGKSMSGHSDKLTNGDHPRVCGEKEPELPCVGSMMGSPPRMRGKVQGLIDGINKGRITPAYAGKSARSCERVSRGWDHPRVCGEKSCKFKHHRYHLGSPPRMRGKGASLGAVFADGGITPAYAGKRPDYPGTRPALWDHPRVCGEKQKKRTSKKAEVGSPPRMRGKVVHHAAEVGVAGDHPRVCGEKTIQQWRSVPPSGSPPRMRGKAGGALAADLLQKDHPRVCGEKTKKIP